MIGPVWLWLLYLPWTIALSVADIRTRRIPNRLVFSLVLVSGAVAIWTGEWKSALLGAAAFAAPLALPVLLLGPEKAGVGDVKLGLFLGLALGWPLAFWALLASFIMGATVGGIAVLLGKMEMTDSLPFAPFLVAGAYSIVLLVNLIGPSW